MEALVTLPPLFAVQSHSLSLDILLLSNQQSLTARLLKSLSLLPISSFSHFLYLLQSEEVEQASHVQQSQKVPMGAAVSGCQLR